MSQINDALKRIQKTSPGEMSDSLPPLEPVAPAAPSVVSGLIPAIVIILVVAAVFFIGWAMVRQPVRQLAVTPIIAPSAAPEPVAVAQPVVAVTAPAVAPATVPPPSPVIPVLPKLQGIFYSSTTPSAIVDGQTVRPGDQFKQYRVKKITKLEVTLMDTEGKTTKLVMGN